jgi:hypothetical protein
VLVLPFTPAKGAVLGLIATNLAAKRDPGSDATHRDNYGR